MTTFYYHVTNKDALAKVAALQAERARIRAKVEAYCQQFATPENPIKAINFYAGNFNFAGIVFKGEMSRTSWCAPSTRSGHQRPRANLNIKGATAEQKAEHADLLKRWSEIPKDSVDMDEVFVALIGVGNDFMTSGSANEAEDGSMWVSYTRQATLTDGVEEVLASVYDKAVREIEAYEKREREAKADAAKQALRDATSKGGV